MNKLNIPLLQKSTLLLILHMKKYHLREKRFYEILKDLVFLSSPEFPPTVPSKPSLSTNRENHLIPLLSQNNFTFKAQLISLHMHPTDYTFCLYDKNHNFLHPLLPKYCLHTNTGLTTELKFSLYSLTLPFTSIYDLKTGESDPSFLSVSQKLLITANFLQPTKPQNYIFVSYKYTSPYTMTNLYTIDHARITGCLRNYDPIKQYFCLLPFNDTSRPHIVPQEYLIHFGHFLVPCNTPTQIVKPLTVIKHLIWYKQNTKLNMNHLLLNIRHIFEKLLKNFHQC